MNIKQNLSELINEINKQAGLSGRDTEEIRLVAVSKTRSLAEIREAINCGVSILGENKVQEAFPKYEEIGNIVEWHLIGHLQTNKVKKAVEMSDLIHSVDGKKLIDEINKCAKNLGKVQNVLAQVNVSGEETKFGLNIENIFSFFDEICKDKRLTNVRVKGLMTMAPFTDNTVVVRSCFKKTRELFLELRSRHANHPLIDMRELSMGMTNDFKIAIEEGATLLRIGAAIFGEREYL
ncbi:MAG: YggS family pyridoxal phosphate-dependent enzyme [Elusimicrobiota bacterium]